MPIHQYEENDMKNIIKIQQILFLILFFGSSTILTASEISAEDARELIQTTAEDVIAHVESNRSRYEADPSQLYGLVNEKVSPSVDFSRMSRWILGKHWRKASPEQQVQFTSEFRKLLIKTYATALLKFSGEKISYLPVTDIKNGKVRVKSEIVLSDGKHFNVQYRMHNKDKDWKIFDISVDGVSLVSTYRSSFSTEINKIGFEGLLNNLVSKNKGSNI